MSMQNWKTLSRSVVLQRGKFLTVEDHLVELPNGRTIPEWSWVITPNYVNIVVVTEDGKFVCFRQVKYAVEGDTLAIVGGYIEPGEAPEAAAIREIREETGYEALQWIPLGNYVVDANRGAGVGHLFLATGARYVGYGVSDDLEEQELLLLSQPEVERAVAAGEFKIMAHALAMAMALLRLKS